LYRDFILEWLAARTDSLRAEYSINTIFDVLARQRVLEVEGDDFEIEVMKTTDLLSSALLPSRINDFSLFYQTILSSFLLGVPIPAPARMLKITQDFVSKLDSLAFSTTRLIEIIKERIPLSTNSTLKISKRESGWSQLCKLADDLYAVTTKIPGKWHNVYLPFSNSLGASKLDSIFQSSIITEEEFNGIKIPSFEKAHFGGNPTWNEIFFDLLREAKQKRKMLTKMSRASRNLNISGVGFPVMDYVSFNGLQIELAPQIRGIIDRVRMVKNVFDENMFEETGNIDLQVAIQAIASETPRRDMFIKDEKLLKDESWTILVDSSLSLDGSSKQLKEVSICLAETAQAVLSSNPWGMFAFSDQLFCIKDFAETYDNQVKARIGGLTQRGLSQIPDAIRACRNLIAEHSKDRNYLILVSDGIPCGYAGIEAEFAASIKELGKYSIDVAAIGIGSNAIKKTIRRAKLIDKPTDIAKVFTEIYYGLSS
jgi:hypothetical protein